MFSPYAIPPPKKTRNTEETVGRLWETIKADFTMPLSGMGELLSVISVCVIAKSSSVIFPYYPNASGAHGVLSRPQSESTSIFSSPLRAADAPPPEVSMVALALEEVTVKGKFKDFLLQAMEMNETVNPKLSDSVEKRRPQAAVPIVSPAKGNTATDLVKAYSKIRNYEVKLACVLSRLSARVVPVIGPDHFTKVYDSCQGEIFSNIAM
jgi:hypothetical protein